MTEKLQFHMINDAPALRRLRRLFVQYRADLGDRLDVAGALNVTGLQVHLINPEALDRAQTYTLIQTTTGISGAPTLAAKDAAAAGRGVIYLVPEISLTHQVVRRCRTLFGDRLAVLLNNSQATQV